MKRKIQTISLLMLVLAFFLSAGLTSQAQADGAPLKVVKSSKNTAGVEMNNDVPVRGLQFSITGAKVTEVRNTDRTKGFLTKFNEKNGTVLIVSASADSIAPGKGPIVDIICDKPGSISLSNVKIVGVKVK